MEKFCPVCKGTVSTFDAVCPSCGFKLKGATQEFRPVTLPHETGEMDAPASPQKPVSLTVLKGPQVGVSIGLVDNGGAPLMVGRSPKCEATAAGWQITDQNSYNGIWVNNKNVTSTILKNGDIIQIGAFCLRVDC